MWIAISNVSIVLSLLVSLVAIFLAARSVVVVSELRQVLQAYKPWDSRSFETRLLEAEDALKLLANRVKMQKVRNAITHTDRDEIDQGATLKDRLRAKAGLIAGQPAKHS